jgi:regulatory protein
MPYGRSRRDDTSRTPPAVSARTTALRLLGRRDYTAAELSSRLLRRGYLEEDVQKAVADLAADGSLDDARAAFAHVRTAAAVKGRGRLRIRRELEARGVSRAITQDALSQLSEDDDRRAIEKILARRRGGGPLDAAGRRKLFQQLLRRGFSASTITAALRFDPTEDESSS